MTQRNRETNLPDNEKRERVRARAVLLRDWELVRKIDEGPVEAVVSTLLDRVAASHAVEQWLTMREVAELTRFSKTHVWRLIRAGDFPQPVTLGRQRVAFRKSEVREWMAGRERGIGSRAEG